MARPTFNLTQASIKSAWPQVLFLLGLVILFSLNAAGLMDFKGGAFLGMNVRKELFFTANGSFGLPDTVKSAEFFLLLFSSFLLALTLPVLKPIAASLLVLALTIPPAWLAIGFPYREPSIPMQFSLLVLLILFGVNVLLTYFSETQRKQKLIEVFGQYVPPEIVQELSMQPEQLNLDGESKDMTVMFCDLQNFSSISEQMTPRELVSMLNDYFTNLTAILYKYGATIDKYIGDSIMAFWSAPITQQDHARRAVLASFEMQEEVNRLSKVYTDQGWPPVTMGIGINSGMMNVGNMGSKYRLAYTVIGDAVNLSSRLQSMTRIYHIPTIVGEGTANRINDIAFKELDMVRVKGKKIISRIYQPIGPKDQVTENNQQMLALHGQAMACYYQADYDGANNLFCRLIQQTTGDEAYYRYMLKRVGEHTNVTEVSPGDIS